MSSRAGDDPDRLIEQLSSRDVEPPPMGRPMVPPPYSNPIPFGAPPEQPIELVEGEIPWELRDSDSDPDAERDS